ncbi:hypothetical protein JX265_000098 [Neoarthrinium moseri]|uniref:Protein kinase domain-containing protein n=1 Tax=Neoarthrinium moseri TaxID=1658444 RepID=A0A9P9WXX3_9PEZI|nr:hypothetical protein JX266_008088 [Neoarthrinium moseri]KAI1881272.1 hypothetical protein JX265_000098 [Neoarthrinium moseri]
MATQAEPSHEPPAADYNNRLSSLWKRIIGRNSVPASSASSPHDAQESASQPLPGAGLLRRASRKVVPGLPRAKTFKRQQSEVREKLEATKPSQAERRAVSVDRRGHHPLRNAHSGQHLPRASAPDFLDDTYSTTTAGNNASVPQSPVEEKQFLNVPSVSTVNVEPLPEEAPREAIVPSLAPSAVDAQSIRTSLYDAQIHEELERKWILNLSMHFRDRSKREKFFVTYREKEHLWRRVTISLDYRNAPDESLERELSEIKFQREKSAKIYEAIRESLQDIQFYESVTNLKLQTTDGRLHVHVVEDVNEIIHFPTVRMVQHLKCRRIRESDIEFDSHMSGFVYKVKVDGRTLIKKEIPGPDTVDEFLYEVNALNSLRFSSNVIGFHGVVVDDEDQKVKGLLIDYAEQGALIEIIYDSQEHGLDLPWATREKWARQIVQGLSDIHEAGFVQGDFTLSNIVIDDEYNAKIIDINRRGCPVGWEPPEATPLIDSNQRISMYIGVKSDLYQLGMVLWALATLEDEPEAHRRPLHLDPEIEVPTWYRRIVENCLSENPRVRMQATALLPFFPETAYDDDYDQGDPPSISVDDGYSVQQYLVDGYERNGRPVIRTVTPQSDVYYSGIGCSSGLTSPGLSDDAYYYPPRGRSPPSPLPSNVDDCDTPFFDRNVVWSDHPSGPPSASDVGPNDAESGTPTDTETAVSRYLASKTQTSLQTQETAFQDQSPDPVISTSKESQCTDVAETDKAARAREILAPEIPEPLLLDGPNELESSKRSIIGPAASDYIDSEVADAEPEAQPMLDTTGKTEPAPELGKGKDTPGTASAETSTLHQPQDQSDDDSSGPHYTHIGNDAIYTPAPPEQSSSTQQPEAPTGVAHEMTGELTGIGMAYGEEDDIRQPMCSDEDLGLATTAPQNVTSQA